MGMSARVMGREFGLTAQEMNALLKQHGYLNGEPGAYRLTEKGQQYGDEQHNDNGYGGYAYRAWETRTWNEDTATALRADMEANPGGSLEEGSPGEQPHAFDDDYDRWDPEGTRDEGGVNWKVYAATVEPPPSWRSGAFS